jgi:multicomponent Na+:H+ antiporter subunit D
MLEYGFRYHGRTGLFGRTWPTGSMALWMAVLLGGALILYYLRAPLPAPRPVRRR